MILEPLLLVGGGGHCLAVIDVVEAAGRFAVRGVLDRQRRRGELVAGYRVLGDDSSLEHWVNRCRNVHVALGAAGAPTRRAELFDLCVEAGAALPVIASPRATVSRSAELGPGTVVMHHALVNAGVRIGANGIVNSAAVVEHSSVLGDHVHVAPHATVLGDVRLGDRVFIGASAVVKESLRIADDCIVGAGAVVLEDLQEAGVYVGSPARKLRSP